jgi:hypothetical protein
MKKRTGKYPQGETRDGLRAVKSDLSVAPPDEGPKVWLYVVDGKTSEDLAILDATGADRWRANRRTKKGDLILMYRSAPYSDIAYVFVAADNAFRTKQTRDWEWKWGINITGGRRLPRSITLNELKASKELGHWSRPPFPLGIMDRSRDLKDEGVWSDLRKMLEIRGADLPKPFQPQQPSSEPRYDVFLSYVRENEEQAIELRNALARERIETFLDSMEILPGDQWESKIKNAIKDSKVFVVCLSQAWLRSERYARTELKLALEWQRENFLLPVKFDDCREPDFLEQKKINSVDLFGPNRGTNLKRFCLHVAQVVKRPQTGLEGKPQP